MALTISVEKVSDDQFFLMNGIEVVGMVVAMRGGGWLGVHANPFLTFGPEPKKEAVADKIVELHLNMDYQK